jgi:uncharacterized protein (TIGR03067 family)
MNTDLEAIQGNWDIVTLEVDGHTLPRHVLSGCQLSIRGTKFKSRTMGSVYEGTIEVDDSSNPKTFDLVYSTGPSKGLRSRGIYELDDEDWLICLAWKGGDRPHDFMAGPGIAVEALHRAR